MSGDYDETHWDTPLNPEPTGGILGKLAEVGKREEFLTKVSSPRSLSVVPGREKKVKFHIVPSFPHSDWQEK